MTEPTIVEKPLVIIFENAAGQQEIRIHPPFDYQHGHYGLLVCDLVRHIAAMFKVPEDKIWYWVDKERARPTTGIGTQQHAFPSGREH